MSGLLKMTGAECYEYALYSAAEARRAEDEDRLTDATHRWREAQVFATLASAAAGLNNEYVDSRNWDIVQGREVPPAHDGPLVERPTVAHWPAP